MKVKCIIGITKRKKRKEEEEGVGEEEGEKTPQTFVNSFVERQNFLKFSTVKPRIYSG